VIRDRFSLVPLVSLVALVSLVPLVGLVPCMAEEGAKPRTARASRLTFQAGERGDSVATLGGKPYTGIAFTEESWGRAEVTYSNGILHGPVTVIVRGRLYSQFSYDQGRRVVTSGNSVTSGSSATNSLGEAGDGGGDR